MANNKTFIIQIDGIDKAYEDLGKLSERLSTIDKQIGNSKTSTLISEAFGQASQVVSDFSKNIDNLAAAVNGLQPLITAVGTLQRLNTEAISTIQANIEKQVEKTGKAAKKEVQIEKSKIEDIKTITIESMIEKGKVLKELEKQRLKDVEKFRENLKEPEFLKARLADLEAYKKRTEELENLSKKFGDEIKYTEESKKLYANYYVLQENLYRDDAEKLKKTLAEKEAYQKAYIQSNKNIQGELDTALKVIPKDKAKELIKELKNLSDLKEEANLHDLVIQKENIKQEEKLQTERNTRISDLETAAIERNTEAGRTFNFIKLKETKENYEHIKNLRLENTKAAKDETKRVGEAYDEMAKAFEKGSTGEAVILEEKKKKLSVINAQIIKDQQAVNDSTKTITAATQLYYDELAKKITDFHTKWTEVYGAMGGVVKGFLDLQITGLKEDQEETVKVIAEKTKAYEEHTGKVKSLEEEAKTATGGRAIVVQEQLAREMEAQAELLKQKKEAETEKEEIDKQIARKKKQQAKIDKVQEIAKATANQAAAIIKAWGMGPILGPIMAGITALATGIQIVKMKQEWDKLEDGGLLRGKRHSQGGMRIEGSNIEVEGDEFVVNRVSTRKNLGLIEYINTQRKELSPADLTTFFARNGQASTVQQHTIKHMYEQGGQLTNLEVIDSATAPDNNKILEAISRINFQPVVSVVDIANTQSSIAQVKDIAGA
ncbi:hypothetical protein G7050_11900 [Dysgonomonas sp. HDW5A]|uniref:hypothetical protein n=1 Tax=Dysgonomonas sp. HDW5A TaxID=2714926 RepID=UPI00140954B9|nr:hypothetical protein [Dysgonomonas sp. HDW5A]QIK60492.1 hypothetical protein G7050_11900 [Dysgonomonas sp. HDW5A]